MTKKGNWVYTIKLYPTDNPVSKGRPFLFSEKGMGLFTNKLYK